MSGAEAIGLAASIITFVDLTAKIVSRLQEYYVRSSELPESFKNLVIQLPLLSVTLQRIHRQTCAGNVDKDVGDALKPLIQETKAQAEILWGKLDSIRVPDSADKLTKGVAALKSILREGSISKAVEKLQGCIRILVLHETASTHDLGTTILDKLNWIIKSSSLPTIREDPTKLLHEACRQGLHKTVRIILSFPTPVDARDDEGRTPLMTAVLFGQKTIVVSLCDNFKADVNASDYDGRTALHLAISLDQVEIAWLLHSRKADLNCADSRGTTPLDLIDNDFLTHWKIQNGMNINAQNRITGNTALTQAICRGDLDSARLLIENGADIHKANVRLSTALAEACSRGYIDIISALLDRGADPNIMDISNESPFTRCLLSNQLEALELVIDHGQVNLNTTSTRNRRPILLEAIFDQQWSIVESLLQKGANPNLSSTAILPKLIMWCWDEPLLVKLIHLIIDRGVNVHERDDNGMSPIMLAADRLKFNAFEALLSRGASANESLDQLPLICKFSQGENDIKWIRVLARYGANLEAVNRDGWTALREAVNSCWIEIVMCLLELGANPNERVVETDFGEHRNLPLLSHAVWKGRMWEGTRYRAIIPALIRKGARLEDRDSQGWTALRTAVERNYEEIACLLLHYGANPFSESDGDTVFAVAEKKKMHDFCVQAKPPLM